MEHSKKNPRKKFCIKEIEFLQIIKDYSCLLETSQTPVMKVKKREALQAAEERIRKQLGCKMTLSQIKKKLENMKSRVRAKSRSSRTKYVGKQLKKHEMLLLELMGVQHHRAVDEMPEIHCGMEDTNVFGDEEPDEEVDIKYERTTPPLMQSTDTASVLQLQKEVLELQKELNEQQREINGLKKIKLILEIEKLRESRDRLSVDVD